MSQSITSNTPTIVICSNITLILLHFQAPSVMCHLSWLRYMNRQLYKLSHSQHSKEPPAFQDVLQKTLQRFSSGNAKATRSSHNTITKCMLQPQLLLNQDASLSGERRNNVQENCLKPFAKPSELSREDCST
jgi:hypothetical protein